MGTAGKLERALGVRAMKPRQIREAASRLFLANGYGAVSMDAIAREAGVSKATIYAHFADKAELFAALVTEECARQWPDIGLLEAEPGDLRETLLALGTVYAELLVSPKVVQTYRMVVAEAPRFPELGRAFYEGGPGLICGKLAAYLARAAAQGKLTLGDARLAAQQFLALLRCEYHLRAVIDLAPAPTPAEIARVAAAATDMFLRAYGR
ncbi:MAG TPA: TetR/AcrR family transcriptional regulator [Stellaceae bacterium]|nr:TetR/AcrR family transcriptional regulator [Stellaceae bacterium]